MSPLKKANMDKPDEETKQVSNETLKQVSFACFLESLPPTTKSFLSDSIIQGKNSYSVYYYIEVPEIKIECDHEDCNGIRFFKSSSDHCSVTKERFSHTFLSYTCKNCGVIGKYYSLLLHHQPDDIVAAIKVGEWPPFGPKTPPRLLRILGDDKDLFLCGRRAEFQGLGMGAFTYYRRVVENKKNLLFDEIIKVVKKVGDSSGVIEQLESAKKDTQFTKAVDSIKLPQGLLIDGCHNPLKLLHTALSTGIHGKPDNECLELAQSIRLVLVEFIEKLEQALVDHKELNKAVSQLWKANTKKAKTENDEG